MNYTSAMPTDLHRTEFHSSELSRNSVEVFTAAEERPIKVTRRGAEPLVLMTERESNARKELFEFAATLIAVTTDDRGTITERMADRLPWMLALSPREQEQCSLDLVAAARASFATDQPHLAVATLTAWRETAELVAAGIDAAPVEWHETSSDVIVERP